jgi:hypothetical protein
MRGRLLSVRFSLLRIGPVYGADKVTEVRFKNNGLDSIEVQDNGAGISPADYDTIGMLEFFVSAIMSPMTDFYSFETLHVQALDLR